MTSLARQLGERGVWVDQVTTLDPHPLANPDAGVFPLGVAAPDEGLAEWGNVVFADNYWRRDPLIDGWQLGTLDFNGHGVAGTVERQFADSWFAGSCAGAAHSDVHSWYFGTVDTALGASDTECTPPSSWYGGTTFGPRDQIGYYWSRIGGGVRPQEGVSLLFDGDGGRIAVTPNGPQWPNVIIRNITDNSVTVGNPVEFSCWYQDTDTGGNITVYIDTNQNPYDGFARQLKQESYVATLGLPNTRSISASTAGATPDTYFLCAKIADSSGRVRYDYWRESIVIAPIGITVQTSHSDQGLDFTVDGNPYNSTTLFEWLDGTSHILSVTAYQFGNNGGAYGFKQWSDGNNSASRTVVASGNATYTAIFTNSGAIQTTLTASEDTTVLQDYPDENFYRNSAQIFLQEIANQTHWGLVKFPLQSIPPGSTVSYAELCLFNSLSGSGPLYVREVLGNWDELVTWNTRPTMGSAFVAQASDNGDGVFAFKSSDYSGIKTIVQADVNNPNDNNGFYLRCGTGESYGLYSSEYGTSSDRPRLVVHYTPPPDNSGDPIVNLRTKRSSSSTGQISQNDWQRDNDPFFYWETTNTISSVVGYSIALDATPDNTVDVTVTNYAFSSDSISDGQHVFRVKSLDAEGHWGPVASFNIWVDANAPTSGTISINNGAATTWSPIVTLNSLGANASPSGLDEMKFSNDGSTWTSYETSAPNKTGWDLFSNGGNTNIGTKTVYIRYKDNAGNESAAFTDTVSFDPTPRITGQPVVSPAEIEGNQIILSITAEGYAPLTYQWLKEGTPLEDDGRISGVATPTLVISAAVTNDCALYSVRVSNTYASVTNDPTFVRVVPRSPQLITALQMPWPVLGVAAHGYRFHAVGGWRNGADYYGGYAIIERTSPSNWATIGVAETEWVVTDVVATSSYAYGIGVKLQNWGGGESALLVWDITTGTNPVAVAEIPLVRGRWNEDVVGLALAISGKHLFISGYYRSEVWSGEILVYDLSQPSQPELLTYLGDFFGPEDWFRPYSEDIVIANNLAYLPHAGWHGGGGGLTILDVYDPESASIAGRWMSDIWPTAVSVFSKYGNKYAGLLQNNEIHILNVGNPDSAIYVSDTPIMGGGNNVRFIGSRAYVTEGAFGITVCDTEDITQPVIVGRNQTGADMLGLVISEGTIVTAEGTNGVGFYSIPQPLGPEILDLLAPEYVLENDQAWFSVEAWGTPQLSYQWYFGTNPLFGATNAEFSIPAAQLANAGAYFVVITNDYGSVTSSNATLTVVPRKDPVYVSSILKQWRAWALDGVGNHTYLLDDDTLIVLDIGDLSNVRQIGSCRILNEPYGLLATASHLFHYGWDVGNDQSYVEMVDVNDPSDPTPAGVWTFDNQGDFAIAASEHLAYVAWDNDGLQLDVLDVSNPTNPVRVGGCVGWSGWAESMIISNNFLFVVGDELQVFDISDPENPAAVGVCELNYLGYEIAMLGEMAYIAGRQNGADISSLEIVDVSNKASPVILGSCANPGGGLPVAIKPLADQVLIIDEVGQFQIVDVAQLENPIWVDSHPLGVITHDARFDGTLAYVAAGKAGLQVFDITVPANALRVGGTPVFAAAEVCNDVAISGNYAYVAEGNTGLHIIDVSEPDKPIWVGGYDTSGYAGGVAVSNNHAFLADGNGGLQVIDVSDPTSPQQVGSYNTSGWATDVELSEDRIYLSDEQGLQVIDVSDPTNPQQMGNYDTSGYAISVKVSGNYAYLVDENTGLQFIDVRDPVNPAWLGEYASNGDARDVAFSGSHVLLADEETGLHTLNATNPANPVRISRISGHNLGVAVSGNYAYVTDYTEDSDGNFTSSRVGVVDVNNLSKPIKVGSFKTAGNAGRIALAGDHAYVADGPGGLVILRVGQGGTSSPTILQQPFDRHVPAGTDTGISVTASGSFPLRCQWYFDGALIAGKTNAWLAFTNTQPSQAGNYYVVVTNSFGSVTSTVATIKVIVRPQIEVAGGSLGFESGQFAFNIRAMPGQIVIFETSTNLINWLPIYTNIFTSDLFRFSDPDSASAPMRFYRAVSK